MGDRSPDCQHLLDDEINAAWLTALLRASGQLPRGDVATLAVERWRAKRLSDLYRLRATYSEDVGLPERFVLKRSRSLPASAVAKRRRWKEHEFYTQLTPLMSRAPAPRHFTACLSADAGRALLLLEDLSATHSKPPAHLPPELAMLPGDVDCLASLHADWWERDELRQAARTRDDAWIAEKCAAARRLIRRFVAKVGGEASPAARQALAELAEAWPAILRRARVSPLTVVHGDAHPWNFLTPLDPARGRTVLLDWEAWAIEPGPYDLASLITLHVPSAARAAQEDALLVRYVGQLQRHGVVGYGLAECQVDYRWAVARKMMAPVGMWSRGSRARVWQPMLERITAAYHDLRCADLLSA